MPATPSEIHPLSIPDFRRYWLARFMAVLATMGMVVVIGYQVYDIARSDYGVGNGAPWRGWQTASICWWRWRSAGSPIAMP
jgi:hypothetical protein